MGEVVMEGEVMVMDMVDMVVLIVVAAAVVVAIVVAVLL
jgi:hypothetical protein